MSHCKDCKEPLYMVETARGKCGHCVALSTAQGNNTVRAIIPPDAEMKQILCSQWDNKWLFPDGMILLSAVWKEGRKDRWL